jgi:hypothetical protein
MGLKATGANGGISLSLLGRGAAPGWTLSLHRHSASFDIIYRQRVIDDCNVLVRLDCFENGFLAVDGFGDHLAVWLTFQDCAKFGANHIVVIGNRDGGRGALPFLTTI